MLKRRVCLLILALSLASAARFQPVSAQGEGEPLPQESGRPTNAEYLSQCLRNGLRCKLIYADTAKAPRSELPPDRKPFTPRQPIVDGPLAIVLVLVGVGAVIGLWMRFGNGGVLLSAAPRQLKQRQGEIPESWHASANEGDERPHEFLQRISAMEDRRQALILLLRHCLLHAADATGTRLLRSDTERAVLGRLPQTMPGRHRLEGLLTEAELVHYGGRELMESQFAVLLATARDFLSVGELANA